jgi:hypothetical protein
MYTKKQFGFDLKNKLSKMQNIRTIADWAFLDDVEEDLTELLLTLTTMEEGQEFEYTIEELHEIADRLIKGDPSITHIGIDPNVKLKCSK